MEFFQLTTETRYSNANWPQWLHIAWSKNREDIGSASPTILGTGTGTITIITPDGQKVINFGDYIILDLSGNLQKCKLRDFYFCKVFYKSIHF